MLDLVEIKAMHDRAYTNNQVTRVSAADDLLFQYVTQWDSSILENSQLGYKGQFDILTKAIRETLSDLRTNQVQIEFEPVAESREADADLINGLYLSCDRENPSIEAYDNGTQECVTCGIGGWELYTTYESMRSGSRHQVIKRRPLYEFNNNCFPDPNAKRLDKSDALYWSLLEPCSKEGYQKIYKELTGEETDAVPTNFSSPECSYVFPWVTGNEIYYLVRFYHKTKVKDKILTFTDPFGQVVKYRESDLYDRGENEDIDLRTDLERSGYRQIHEKKIERWQVTLYIASGEEILKTYTIPGEYIPVVPMYGERQFVEGEETYRGTVRLAKDPQRLHNFVLSYLGDIVSRSPREKPIFTPEQLAGYENMYDINGADNNFPYVYQRMKDTEGNPLPMGPVGTLPAPQMPPSMGPLLELTRQAVEDVANPGLPKDILDSDLSGHAIERLQARLDNQSQVYQDHKKHAKRYDALVFASMAPEVYDSPRKVTLTLPDGSRKTAQIMQSTVDGETGDPIVLNDLSGLEFEVFAQLGPSYDSKRQQTYEKLGELADGIAPTDPNMAKMLRVKQLTLVEGVNFTDIRDYANKQLIMAGVKQPETEEEIEFAQQMANQPQQPDANLILAQGELLKGQAAVMKEQREAENDVADKVIDTKKLQLDAFNAKTKRMDTQIKAAQVGATIHLTRAKIVGEHAKARKSIVDSYRARVNG